MDRYRYRYMVFTIEGFLEEAIENWAEAWVGFEPTTTEFRSDALTNWAIRSWVQSGPEYNSHSEPICECYASLCKCYVYVTGTCISDV